MIAKIILAAVAAGFCLSSIPASAADRIYLMRHLPKAEGQDPPLTSEGTAQAKTLAEALANQKVAAVFATPTRRTQATGAPLAERLGIAVTSYDANDPTALVQVVEAVRGSVLIIGHNNTIPDLVERFGGERPPPITEQDYGTIYLVEPPRKQVRQFTLTKLALGLAE